MQVATMTARLRTRTTRPSAAARRNHRTEPTPIPPAEVERHRQAGGPEDHALYRCSCGYAFTAEVSASVGCPRCGTAQAW
jgi:transposase-like protein